MANTTADAKRGSKVWGPPGGTPGVCLTCGGPARSSKAFYCEEHRTTDHQKKSPPAPAAPSADEELAGAGAGPAGEVYAERTPTEPKAAKPEGVLGRFWKGKDKDKADAPKPTAERKPSAPKRRASTAPFWGDLVGPISAVAARGGYVPMARAMQWSSPVAGEILEDATKGTLVDRLVQPVVRNSEKWEDLFNLLGFWAAIGVAQRNPAQAGAALTFARGRLVNLLPRIAKNIKAERAKERDAVEALTEMMPDLKELFPEMGPDDDPVALLIQSLFAAPENVGEPVAV